MRVADVKKTPHVLSIGAFLLLTSALFAPNVFGQVTFERLLNSSKEPQNWLTYSGNYAGQRFSTLDQVNTTTAPSLAVKWVYQTGATGKFETTPLVVRSQRVANP